MLQSSLSELDPKLTDILLSTVTVTLAIMAVILLYGVFLTLMNLAVDLVYGFIDPRIRY